MLSKILLHQAVKQKLGFVKGLLNDRFGFVDLSDGLIVLLLHALRGLNNLEGRDYRDIEIRHCLPNSHIFDCSLEGWK